MPSSGATRKATGNAGEELACKWLETAGYRILARNVHTRYGELDCIAQEGATLVFVEIKTRRDESFGRPEEAVTVQKRQHLCRAALVYLQQRGWTDQACRFDVLSVQLGGGEPEIRHLRDAFRCDDLV